MKIDYENLKPKDIEKKDINLNVGKEAFKGPAKCTNCRIKMKQINTDVALPGNDITVHIEAYQCPKCKKQRLTGDQAEKLDYFMSLTEALKNKARFKFRRAMNFDGHSWFVRFPNEVTRNWKKKIESDIIPLTNSDYLIRLHR